jgi:nitrogen fixation/metabolism regulation signal transduction histidine kinase
MNEKFDYSTWRTEYYNQKSEQRAKAIIFFAVTFAGIGIVLLLLGILYAILT